MCSGDPGVYTPGSGRGVTVSRPPDVRADMSDATIAFAMSLASWVLGLKSGPKTLVEDDVYRWGAGSPS